MGVRASPRPPRCSPGWWFLQSGPLDRSRALLLRHVAVMGGNVSARWCVSSVDGTDRPVGGGVMRATAIVEGQLIGLAGRLDVVGAGVAREALHSAVAAGDGPLVVDMSEVELLDATGLGVLIGTHRRARRAGRQLVLRDA